MAVRTVCGARRSGSITHRCRFSQDTNLAGSARCTDVVPGTARPPSDSSLVPIPDALRHGYCGRLPVTGALRTTRGRGVMGGNVLRLREGDDHAM